MVALHMQLVEQARVVEQVLELQVPEVLEQV
jgi:hypothetical protein